MFLVVTWVSSTPLAGYVICEHCGHKFLQHGLSARPTSSVKVHVQKKHELKNSEYNVSWMLVERTDHILSFFLYFTRFCIFEKSFQILLSKATYVDADRIFFFLNLQIGQVWQYGHPLQKTPRGRWKPCIFAWIYSTTSSCRYYSTLFLFRISGANCPPLLGK